MVIVYENNVVSDKKGESQMKLGFDYYGSRL